MKTGKIIRKSIRSEHLGISQFWEFFCQPFGENAFSKNGPQTNIEHLFNEKTSKFLSNPNYSRAKAYQKGIEWRVFQNWPHKKVLLMDM